MKTHSEVSDEGSLSMRENGRENRLRRIIFPYGQALTILMDHLTNSHSNVVSNLPSDARHEVFGIDPVGEHVELLISSSAFSKVDCGERIPEFDLRLQGSNPRPVTVRSEEVIDGQRILHLSDGRRAFLSVGRCDFATSLIASAPFALSEPDIEKPTIVEAR